MREIKFRAWDKKRKEMMYADGDYHFIIYEDGHVDFASDNPEAAVWGGSDIEVMQFTGLKDSQGHDIYEGDILDLVGSTDQHGDKCIGEVVFTAAKFKIRWSNKKIAHWADGIVSRWVKIIGNVYQNPELMKREGG